MKALLLLSFLTGLNTYACPDLTGEYRCKSKSNTYDIIIEQQPNGEHTQYWFLAAENPEDRDDSVITDGVLRKRKNTETVKRGKIKAWCDGDKLIDVRWGDLYVDGEFFTDFELKSKFYIKNGKLIWDETGMMTFPVDRQTICTPL